ncbi:glutathione S-transferase [Hoeflea sp. WL0058]|uniref:Glutathione S-transferase n=1 Tax=Flavimaribacter sediminis TaxID=2865987 RepID=A0AAE3D1P5_9HYPH|nr:glutathione S-transferase [Flavimaribacter sediminis]MBW8639875.1 glutathione S-transferase [Flavimaribacter sediminis]
MLTLIGRRSSFNVQKVAWLLAELDLPHRHIELGGAFGGLDTPEFRLMNPHGKVPVLKDGDTVLWESHAILRYLASLHAKNHALWPEDIAERANVDSWMDWSQTTLQVAFLTGVFWGYYRTPEAQRDTQSIERSVARCADHFRLLDTVMADKPWLFGEAMTLADITIGTHLYRYFEVDIDRPDIPNIVRWYERLKQRSAYRDAVMVPFDELFGRLEY